MRVERIKLQCECGTKFVRYARCAADTGSEYNRMMGDDSDRQCPVCRRHVAFSAAFLVFPSVEIGGSILVWDEAPA